MQQLVKRHVQSPLQAQQAWQVAVRLQGRPLHKVCSRVLGGAVVSLVEVSWLHTEGPRQQQQQQPRHHQNDRSRLILSLHRLCQISMLSC
jgi:hypothetical protein